MDLLAGEIVGNDDSVRRVTALSRKREASPLACEKDPVRDQILDIPGPSLTTMSTIDPRPTRAHPERVLVASNESLGSITEAIPPCARTCRVGRAALRDDADGPAFRGLEREEEARLFRCQQRENRFCSSGYR